MERLIFVLFALVFAELAVVRGDQCDDTNVLLRYKACRDNIDKFLMSTDTSVPRCKMSNKKAGDCFKTLRGNCGTGPVAKWFEYVTKETARSRLLYATCDNLKNTRTFMKCRSSQKATIQCLVKGIKSSKDLCGSWKAAVPCYRQMFGKCSADQLKVVEQELQALRPDACNRSTVIPSSSPTGKVRREAPAGAR